MAFPAPSRTIGRLFARNVSQAALSSAAEPVPSPSFTTQSAILPSAPTWKVALTDGRTASLGRAEPASSPATAKLTKIADRSAGRVCRGLESAALENGGACCGVEIGPSAGESHPAFGN